MLYLPLVTLCFFTGAECNFITNYEKHFGSKTPYRAVANHNLSTIEFEGCQPKKIWYIIRHGARTPTDSVLLNMKRNLPHIAQMIILANNHSFAHYIDELKEWKLPFGNETVLTQEGGRELLHLASRTQARFPTLFPKEYSKQHYYFKYTDAKRTMSSALNFTLGLFGDESINVEFPTPAPQDPILRFYKSCARWKEEVHSMTYEEIILFRESDIVKNVIASINRALNLNGTLTFGDVDLMHKACVHEAASFKHSVWCALLSFDALKVFEFQDSLASYFKNGYLFEVTYKQACPLFNAMIDHFKSEDNPTTAVYFTHDGTLLKFYAHLGLFKDSNGLKHTDYNEDYKWDVSKIGPFATNIAFVMFKCASKEKVAVLFNERLINLPNCGELCDFETIKTQYNDSISNCSYRQICNITKA